MSNLDTLSDDDLENTIGGEIFFGEDPCTTRIHFPWFVPSSSFPLCGSIDNGEC